MMAPVHRIDGRGADACAGTVRLDPAKVLWNGTMLAGTLAAPFFASWASVALFGVLLYATLLLGHSVGMHRMMIHRAADARPWLFRALLLLGTWVGIGGPAQVVRTHDERDWAQRQAQCHAFFAHTGRYPKDLFWQLFCRFDYSRPPTLTLEPELADDPVVAHLSRHWRAHQLALAALLFAWGGLPFVLWGVCVRVLVSAVGHWSVTYVCHNPGPGRYHVHGAGVQASDLADTGRVRAWVGGGTGGSGGMGDRGNGEAGLGHAGRRAARSRGVGRSGGASPRENPRRGGAGLRSLGLARRVPPRPLFGRVLRTGSLNPLRSLRSLRGTPPRGQ